MKLVKLIVQAALIAMFALYALHANAQTMGEYATTTASVGDGASSAGTAIGSDIGGSSTWGASSVGASFNERAGAASGSGSSGSQDFESRAGSSGAPSSDSRWPQPQLDSSVDRFNASDRFSSGDRFKERGELSNSSDRFPGSRFNDNKLGLDTHYSSSSGLDKSYNSANN